MLMVEKKYDASIFAKTLLSHTDSIESIKESQALIDAKLDKLLERRTEPSASLPPTVEPSPPPSNQAAVVPQLDKKAPSKGFLDHFFAKKATPLVETVPKKDDGWLDKVDILTILAFAFGLMMGLGICLIVFVALRF
jgi:hypothetical protein